VFPTTKKTNYVQQEKSGDTLLSRMYDAFEKMENEYGFHRTKSTLLLKFMETIHALKTDIEKEKPSLVGKRKGSSTFQSKHSNKKSKL